MPNMIFRKIPLSVLEIPSPPAGSDYDQSTLDNEPDTAYVVAGEVDGDPAKESYWAQGFKNTRANLTGFGCVLAFSGTVSNTLAILLSDGKQNPNDPNSEFITGGEIDASGMNPDTWYYIYGTTSEPIPLTPGKEYFVISATNEPFTDGENPNGWLWAGLSSNIYPSGTLSSFNGTTWTTKTGDTLFFTWTSLNGGNGNGNGNGNCEDYTNRTDCENAGCYWYQKYLWEDPKCYSAEQNMMMDYLPFIIAGVGGLVIVMALMSRSPATQPMYYPPPQYYYPPPPNHKR